ncbi:hypothetical protein [Allosediminivita pacifica]|uniref:Uncharacterized protein n=1 Tax=Allosediminivita pacifica TaxID=1267769 RepID=A0A2T6B3X6_9RHOB|nr:hypothetical protein [Allosediminivita pacifica]PTX50780.1 hypothetical protein C8N44_104138 [Allosediminivita pacifica]GGB01089.1 hypothetical protein GCM10011324_09260 [Allosediminivita pacifica]
MATIIIFLGGSLLGFGAGFAGWITGQMSLFSAFGLYIAASLTMSLLSVAFVAYSSGGNDVAGEGV